ncbi:hypothetical protein GCM10017673_29450 [Streptosporangium violaceochromogenes]|nr:hypothetical protein GCM10017673_29450 [Streptosporangium violaceochromogenes]
MSGFQGADVISKERQVTTIDIFPARAAGDGVKPAHHLGLDGEGAVTNGGGGLLVNLGNDVVLTSSSERVRTVFRLGQGRSGHPSRAGAPPVSGTGGP